MTLTESQQPKMNIYTYVFLVTFISPSLLLLKCEAHALSKQFQAAAYKVMNNNTLICYDGFMSVYIPKAQFADLPLTIYVQGKSQTTCMYIYIYITAYVVPGFDVFLLCSLCPNVQINTVDFTKSLL